MFNLNSFAWQMLISFCLRCLELGIGIKRNAGKAYEYYKQLGEKGYEYARKKVFEYEYYGDFGFDRTQLKNL